MQSGSHVDRSQRGLDVEPVLPATKPKAGGAIEWNTEQLFGTAHEVSIRHEGHVYRLRRTKLGKLVKVQASPEEPGFRTDVIRSGRAPTHR